MSPQVTTELVKGLPSNVLYHMQSSFTRSYKNAVNRKFLSEPIDRPLAANLLNLALSTIVRKSSFTQTSKGVLSAGFTKSMKYTSEKVLKKIQASSN